MVGGACRQANTLVIASQASRERKIRKRGKKEGGRKGAEGYKWSWATGGHGNDLWLIVVTDRHAA